MKDYVLTATRTDGEPIRLEFDKLSDAEQVMDWAKSNPQNQTLEIRGMGYPLAWFRRHGCRACGGRGRVDEGRWSGGHVVSDYHDCYACNGTGVVIPLTDSASPAPPEALAMDCPLCHQPLLADLLAPPTADEQAMFDRIDRQIAGIAF